MRKISPLFSVLLLTVLTITGCAEKALVVGDGMNVKLHYKGTLEDGSVFDSSEGGEPLAFDYGTGQIIPGLEAGILNLKVGDKKTITIAAGDAYGEYDDAAVMEVPRDQLPPDLEIEAGMQLYAQGPEGMIPVMVKEIKTDTVMMDFNHPLAGKALTFEIEIVELVKAPPLTDPNPKS